MEYDYSIGREERSGSICYASKFHKIVLSVPQLSQLLKTLKENLSNNESLLTAQSIAVVDELRNSGD